MSNWIGTNTGKRIDLTDPDPDQIDIHDIATGLANVCRFGGQLRDWFSVAEHCINVADLCPPEYKLVGLLHDAAEAYICDIPTPLKRELGYIYEAIEARVATAIALHFGLGADALVELPPIIKQADRSALMSERDALQANPQDWGPDYEGSMRFPRFQRRYYKPEDARDAYLVMFHNLTRESRRG